MMLRRSLAAGLFFACAASLTAAPLVKNARVTKELPILLGGSLVLDNPVGDIDIVGSDEPNVAFTAYRNVQAIDQPSLDEGMEQTQIAIGGDARTRIIKTLIPPVHSGKWTSGIRYLVRVPRTVRLSISSDYLSHIRISDMRAVVSVKAFNGQVTLERLTGASSVQAANANVLYIAPDRAMADAALATVNGNIEVRAAAGTRFRWEAATIKGDLRTSFPVHGAFLGSRFHGYVNGEGGPLISTQSLMGQVILLQNGTTIAAAKTVRPLPGTPDSGGEQTVEMRPFEKVSVYGLLHYLTNLGNIVVGEIHGDADVATGAGEVQLGSVFGDAHVISKGGPLNLGQIAGVLTARTEAGDISIQSASKGGTILTGGGTIRLMYTGGDTILHSGGGDIVVREAAGPVNAETQSGDITVAVDMNTKSQKITAKTAKGNIMLYVPGSFAADIDATVVTSDPDNNEINSDFSSLQVRREQIGGKTKIRATGKVNGGGERIELYAEDGGIQISTKGLPGTP